MSDDGETTIELKGLDALVKALKINPPPEIRIGILGGTSARSGKGLNNAEIGAFHEFGTTKLPQRSFLRVPLTENLEKHLTKAGAFNQDMLRQVIATGSLRPWLQKVAVLAEGIVLGAFDSGGYGKWMPSDMRFKKVHQTLVETQQLRNSISFEIKDSA